MFDSKVPPLWMKSSYPSLKPLGAYILDLQRKIHMLADWVDHVPPPVFWLPGFYFPQAFLTGVQQNFARAKKLEIDKLDWNFEPRPDIDPELGRENEPPEWGTYTYGVFLEGAGFDREKKVLREAHPKMMFEEFPCMYLKCAMGTDADWKINPGGLNDYRNSHDGCYYCPVYRTTDRRGVLMTTGHSTNFIMPWYLQVDKEAQPPTPPEHWVRRGTALFGSLPY